MRFALSPEQVKFFHTTGYLSLEPLLTEEQASGLLSSIKKIVSQSPGYEATHLCRSLPQIVSLARKRGWGEMAYELIHKRPLRIGYDAFFHPYPTFEGQIDEDSCGLMINLQTCSGLFFKERLPTHLYKDSSNSYFLLIMTARFLPDSINPVILREG